MRQDGARKDGNSLVSEEHNSQQPLGASRVSAEECRRNGNTLRVGTRLKTDKPLAGARFGVKRTA
jgi:hypothetical protein